MRHCCPRTLFWFMLMVIFPQVVSVVGQQCELHESKDSERCCIERTIGKGYQPVMCDVAGGMISTEQCPANTYQFKEYSSLAFHMCEKHSTCTSPNMVTVMNGNSTSNTVCQCNESGGYYDTQSDTTRPLEYYHCILRTATVSKSSSVLDPMSVHQTTLVHQPTPVHSVPSEDPVEVNTSASTTADKHAIWIPCVIGLVAIIAVIICFRNRLRECCCNRKKNETPELPSNGVINQTRMPQNNGHISDTNDASETEAHQSSLNLMENSNAQNVDENGSHTGENFNMRSDYEISSSLCCQVDMR